MLKHRAIAKLFKGITKNTSTGVHRAPNELAAEKLRRNVTSFSLPSGGVKSEKIRRLAMEHAHAIALQQVRRTQFKR